MVKEEVKRTKMCLCLSITIFKANSLFGGDSTQSFFKWYLQCCLLWVLPWWIPPFAFSFLLAALKQLIYFSSLISALNYLGFLTEDTTRDRYGRRGGGQPDRMLGDRKGEQTACVEQRREEEVEQMGRMTKPAPLNAGRPWYRGNLHRALMEPCAKRKLGFTLTSDSTANWCERNSWGKHPIKIRDKPQQAVKCFRGISSGTCCANTLPSENLLLGSETPVLSRVMRL